MIIVFFSTAQDIITTNADQITFFISVRCPT